ncbi:glycosyltransferase [Stenomitos frigidus]|uniref:Glycosyltransferase n=1 Tax=Stenomitos frigidus ULC18 TaxID=2107698 RepID=A0A2T1DWD9_9CYAN|nr:glycosyltransferase [Stenomitos frigidus]PSB24807.1 glycosyltransferase [Stenomitos frigidus ULC18]
MRVLFVSTHFPSDLRLDVQGTYKRMAMFVEALQLMLQDQRSAKAALDVLFYVPPETDTSPEAIAATEKALSEHWNLPITLFLCPEFMHAKPLSKWQQQTPGMLNFFQQRDLIRTSQPKQIQAFEACLSRQPDAVFIHRLRSMCPAMLTQKPLPPIFFDLDDIEHIAFLRDIRQPPTRLITSLYYLQLPAFWWGERQAIRLAKQTYVCSQHDEEYLTRQGLADVVSIPNAVTMPRPQPLTAEPTLMLLGAYHYYPNINAANFLIENVFPIVRQQLPEARLIIAGKQPENIRTYRSNPPGVEFTGFVDDLDALYCRSRVVCCPILSGGGTRVKLVEAAAYGKPIVSTRIGAEGLVFKDGQDFVQRDEPQAFAAACVALLQNDDRCGRLGASARVTAIKHYDRANIVHSIRRSMQQALGLTKTPTPLLSSPS